MDALKRQLMQMKKDQEIANNRFKDLTRKSRRIEERANQAEAEVKSLEGRIKMKNESYEKCCIQLSEKEAQLVAKGEEADNSEKIRKNMEVKEFENVDDVALLEVKVADANRHSDEVCKKLTDAVARYNKLRVELSNALDRLNTAESRLIALQEESDYETRKLIKLEYRDTRYEKRADYFLDKLEHLEQSYNSEVENNENCLTAAKQLTTDRDKLHSQVQSWNKRVTNLRRELDGTLADINKY